MPAPAYQNLPSVSTVSPRHFIRREETWWPLLLHGRCRCHVRFIERGTDLSRGLSRKFGTCLWLLSTPHVIHYSHSHGQVRGHSSRLSACAESCSRCALFTPLPSRWHAATGPSLSFTLGCDRFQKCDPVALCRARLPSVVSPPISTWNATHGRAPPRSSPCCVSGV